MIGQHFPVEATEAVSVGISSQNVQSGKPTISMIEVLTHLAYRKSLIARGSGIAVASGLILSLLLPVRYTATTKIMPPQQTQSSASMLMSQLAGLGGGSLAAMAGGGLSLKNPNDIYLGLLTSRPVADALIQKFDLAGEYDAGNMTQTRKQLAENTLVSSEKYGFIAISVTDKNKQRAAAMANAYTEELRTLTKTLAVTEATQRRVFYEDQLKQTRESVVAAALAFQQIQQQKGVVALDAQAKAMIEGLSALRAQVAAKEVEVQALRSYSTEQNPEVQLAEKQLSSLETEETRLEQSNPGGGIAALGLGNVPSAGLQYLRAEHELAYQQALYDMLMKQYDAARLDESKDAAIIQVVEPAIEPDRKSSPKRVMIVMLFAFLGFFGSCVFALCLWLKELLHFDPIASQQFAKLRSALKGRSTAEA
jgi:uncharacterized protein involved in exopolysaccharide biosynthesis